MGWTKLSVPLLRFVLGAIQLAVPQCLLGMLKKSLWSFMSVAAKQTQEN